MGFDLQTGKEHEGCYKLELTNLAEALNKALKLRPARSVEHAHDTLSRSRTLAGLAERGGQRSCIPPVTQHREPRQQIGTVSIYHSGHMGLQEIEQRSKDRIRIRHVSCMISFVLVLLDGLLIDEFRRQEKTVSANS